MTIRAAYREAYARARLDRRHRVPSIVGVDRRRDDPTSPGSAVPMPGCYTIGPRRGLSVDAFGRVYLYTEPQGGRGRLP